MSKYYLGYKKDNEYIKIELDKLKDIEFEEIKNVELLLGKNYNKIKYIRKSYINSILNKLIEKDNTIYDKFDKKSYKIVDKLFKELNVDLKKMKLNSSYNMDSIKSINYFTTTFDNEKEMLSYLKYVGLVDKDVDKLFICTKNNDKLERESKAILYSKDEHKLNIEYIKNVFDRSDYDTLIYIFKVYAKKCKYKYPRMSGICNTLKDIAFAKKNSSFVDGEDLKIYNERLKEFIDNMFYGKTNNRIDRKKISYSRINEFIGILNYKDNIKLSDNSNFDEKYVDEDMMNFIKSEVSDLDEFEPYVDGNDYISPLDSEELKDDLIEKYGRKR